MVCHRAHTSACGTVQAESTEIFFLLSSVNSVLSVAKNETSFIEFIHYGSDPQTHPDHSSASAS
jgi:hypothetical protein